MLSTIILFTDCISSFEILYQETRFDLRKTKIKLTFIDGSEIYLREIIVQNVLHDYSYHWQNSDGKLLIRWDNTPHFPSMSTHPHHKHVNEENNVQESHEQTLSDVLNFIKAHLKK